MASLRQNTWILNAWYEQDYAGNVEYTTSEGTLWAWGDNPVGGMGHPPANQYSNPQQIPGTSWKNARAGYRSSMATRNDGTLWGWGYNDDGALGTNNKKNYSSPMQIGSDTDWKRISHGYQVSAATKTDGTLWVWGANDVGQLGQNNTTYRSSPIQVPGSWETAIVNSRWIYGIKADNTLWCMGGNNDYGELGTNTQGNPSRRSSPIQIPGTTWNTIFSSHSPQCIGAIKTDGTLWMWGKNNYGGLGQNQAPAQLAGLSSPTQVPGTTWKTGGQNTESGIWLVKTDGTLWAQGYNYVGSLGLNVAYSSFSSPVQVGTSTDWNIVGGNEKSMWGLRYT